MAAQSKTEDPGFSIQDLPGCFRAEASSGISAHYKLALRKPEEHPDWFTLTIEGGNCTLVHGENHFADCTLIFDPPTLEELVSGLQDVATLYAQRRLGIKGNLDLALKFPKMFALRA